jgi:hypothetical protein
MKFKVINGEPLQFHNQNGDLTGTIQISSSGDMIIRPESGSSNNIIIGDTTTTGTVEFGTTAAPVTLDLLGGGTITSNGNTLTLGDAASNDKVRIVNAIFSQSLDITGSLRVSGSAYAQYFVGDGSGLTNVTTLSASYATSALSASFAPLPNLGGTTNYLSKFTGLASIGNSIIQDNGTTVSINDVPQANIGLWVNSTKDYALAAENFKTTSNTYGIYGGATGVGKVRGVGVYGESTGGTLSNIGTEGVGVGGTVAIGGKFTGNTGTTNYSVQLQDGTEGIGKVLTSMTSDGKAQWVTPSSTASYVTPLTQNVIVTGSLTITNDLTVLGSSSIQYITSSQLNISDNIITVNTITPSIRFGGLAVADSGSSPIQSGSLLFDSQNNQWIFVHQASAGAAITSSVLLMGPQTFNNVGGETTITTNRLTKGAGADLGEHLTDSNITDTGTLVSINSNTKINTTFGNGLQVDNFPTSSTVAVAIYGRASADQTSGTSVGIHGEAYFGLEAIGVKGVVYGEAEGGAITTAIGGYFNGYGDGFAQYPYSVQLRDGTEGTGKVLVSQTADGKANWSTQLSGSYGISGSLGVKGNQTISGSLNVTRNITGSALLITGSTTTDLVRITQTGTGNAFVVEDSTNPDSSSFTIDNAGNVGIGIAPNPSYKLYVSASVTPAIKVQSSNNGIEASGYIGVVGSGATVGVQGTIDGVGTGVFGWNYYGTGTGVRGQAINGIGVSGAGGVYGGKFECVSNSSPIGVYGYVTDDESGTGDYIAGKFEAAGPSNKYSLQLLDGTQGTGKVLVSQTADGKANWSTKLSGSYEITGSLAISGSVKSQSGNTISSDALVQASLLYLSNNF